MKFRANINLLAEMTMARKSKQNQAQQQSLELKYIVPKTPAQHALFEAFYDGFHPIALGSAGTGKSFISIYLGLESIFDTTTPYKKLTICRSAVPSRELGFLPGDEQGKIAIYKRPYVQIVNELLGRADGFEILEKKGIIEFTSTSFLRGTTINDTIIFLDEIQNLSSTELHTVVTRIGRDSALVLAGDFFQNDLSEGESGLREFYEIAKRVKGFRIISFQERDIVRNEFIKEYIIAKNAVEKERKERKQFSGHRIERNYLNSITINGKEHQVVEMPVN